MARDQGHDRVGMEALTQALLTSRYRKSRGARVSAWDRHELTDRQVRYAALDAILTLHVYKRLCDTGNGGYSDDGY